MRAYNNRYSLKDETEMVCEEMKGVILRMFENGELEVEDFINDPYSFMDPQITHGDKWYERIIISRTQKALLVSTTVRGMEQWAKKEYEKYAMAEGEVV